MSENSPPKQNPTRLTNPDWLLVVFIFISIICIGLPLIIYFRQWGGPVFSTKAQDWNNFGTFAGGTLSPIISALSLLITGYIVYSFNVLQKRYQKEVDENQLQQTTINLFKEFRSPQMARARHMAWEMKVPWDKEANETDKSKWVFRKGLIMAMINETPTKIADIDITAAHLRAINDVIAFYTMLSLYKSNKGKGNIESLNYFYYPWWRSFLLVLTEEIDFRYEKCLNKIGGLSVLPDKGVFIENMKSGPPLKALNRMLNITYSNELDVAYELYHIPY